MGTLPSDEDLHATYTRFLRSDVCHHWDGGVREHRQTASVNFRDDCSANCDCVRE